MTPIWLAVLLAALGFLAGVASTVVARRGHQVDQETARRAETRARVFEALRLINGPPSEQDQGLAVLEATYGSDKLDPDDVRFVRTQIELAMTQRRPLDTDPSTGDTEHPEPQEP